MAITFESDIELKGSGNLTGPLLLNGSPGTPGQVPTSAGPGLPPTWGDANTAGIDPVIAGMIF